MSAYECPGRSMPEPEGWVWCYRAGHPCPPAEQIREEDDRGLTVTWRCPCCGDFRGSSFRPCSCTDGHWNPDCWAHPMEVSR